MNAVLFGRIALLHENRAALDLTAEQKRLLERTYTNFYRAGAGLDERELARATLDALARDPDSDDGEHGERGPHRQPEHGAQRATLARGEIEAERSREPGVNQEHDRRDHDRPAHVLVGIEHLADDARAVVVERALSEG